MEIGDIVTIYENTVTRDKPIAKARLIKQGFDKRIDEYNWNGKRYKKAQWQVEYIEAVFEFDNEDTDRNLEYISEEINN